MTERDSSQVNTGDDLVRQELETVMPAIASTLVHAIGTDSCAFYVYDQTASRTIAAFRYGFSQVVFPSLTDNDQLSPRSVPVEAELLRTRRTIRRFTEDDFRRWPMHNDVLRERAQRYSDIAVPLVWNDDVLGVAYLWRRGSTMPFNDDEIAIAEDLGQIAAMAVVFARQYGRERSQRERLDALLDVASVAGSALTVEEVLQHVAGAVRRSSGSDVCNLFVFDENGDHVTDKFSDGINDRERWVFSRSDDYPVAAIPVEERIRETLEAEVVSDFENEFAPDSELVVYGREAGLRQILVVPIVYQREMTGVIYAWYRDRRQVFTNDAVQTIQAIASQAGGIISRARLDEASRQHIQETESLLRIGRAVLTGDSVESVLDEIAGVLAEAIPYDYAYVAMLSEQRDALIISHTWGPFPEEVFNQSLPLDGSLTGWAVTYGELVNVADAHADRRNFRFKPEYIPIRSAMVTPLTTEHGTIGALYIARQSGGGFGARQERLMSLLSQQAAVAIERAKSRDALARRAQRQTFLATVADRLASADDIEHALSEIMWNSMGILADGAAVAFASWEYGTISWVGAALGDEDCSSRLSSLLWSADLVPYQNLIEQLLLRETSDAVPIDEIPWMAPETVEELRQLGVAGLLIVPMRSRGRAPGLLCLMTTGAGCSFSSDVVETAELVASRIGDALERRQMSRNRAALLRASEGMNRRTNLNALMPLIAGELNEIIPYDSLYIGELDQRAEVTRPLYFVNPLGYLDEDVELASNEGLSGDVIDDQVPLLENQAHLHPSSVYTSQTEAIYYATHGESIMAAPLIAQNVVVGVLFMGRIGEHRFNTSDFETFKLFAGLSASAMHRAMLMERNQSIYRASVEVLAALVDARDPTTHQHSRNVAYYGRMCAEMLGLDRECVEQVELAGLLHDIGKLGLSDELLDRVHTPGPGDTSILREHPEHAAAILSQHPALSGLEPLVRHQHERYDRGGLRDHPAEDCIPIGARIIGVVDAFDSIVSLQSSTSQNAIARALEVLESGAGTRFHPEVARVFVREVREGRIDLIAPTLTDAAATAIQTIADAGLKETEEHQPG